MTPTPNDILTMRMTRRDLDDMIEQVNALKHHSPAKWFSIGYYEYQDGDFILTGTLHTEDDGDFDA